VNHPEVKALGIYLISANYLKPGPKEVQYEKKEINGQKAGSAEKGREGREGQERQPQARQIKCP